MREILVVANHISKCTNSICSQFKFMFQFTSSSFPFIFYEMMLASFLLIPGTSSGNMKTTPILVLVVLLVSALDLG